MEVIVCKIDKTVDTEKPGYYTNRFFKGNKVFCHFVLHIFGYMLILNWYKNRRNKNVRYYYRNLKI